MNTSNRPQNLDLPHDLITTIYDAFPHSMCVYAVDALGVCRIKTINSFAVKISGIPAEQWVGKTLAELRPPDEAAIAQAQLNTCIAQQISTQYDQRFLFPTGEIWTLNVITPIPNSEGIITNIVVHAFDITERKRKELATKAALDDQSQIIARQAETLLELSTPLLMIDSKVAVMPVIGAIDSRRAMIIMERLLAGIAGRSLETVIIDITAILMVDTQVANALIRAAHAAKLLGTKVILTGIQPEVALMMIELGVDLQGIQTRNSLQSGIQAALIAR